VGISLQKTTNSSVLIQLPLAVLINYGAKDQLSV